MAAPTFSANDFVEEKPPEGTPPEKPTEGFFSYIGKSAVKGAQDSIKKEVEASQAIGRNNVAGIPEALVRAFVPREWADKAFPPSPAAQAQRKESDIAVGSVERGKAPDALSETLGAGAEGLGSFAGNPVGGPPGLVRGTLGSIGAGMFGDLGRKAGGSLGETMVEMAGDRGLMSKVDPKTGRAVGEVIGSFVGGATGAQANVTRGKVIGAGARGLGAGAKAMSDQGQEELKANFNDATKGMSEKSKGFIQEYVNERLANTMVKGTHVEENITELEAAEKRLGLTGDKSLSFDLAQSTADPALFKVYASQQPQTLEEARMLADRDQFQKKGIVQAFDRIFGSSPSSKEVVHSLEDYRKTTLIKERALQAEQLSEKDALPHFTPETKTQLGVMRDRAYDTQKTAAGEVRDGWYNSIKTAATLDPPNFNLKGVGKETRAILDQTLSQLDKTTIPEPFTKLDGLLKKANGIPDEVKRVRDDKGIWHTETIKGTKGEPVTVDDMLDITKALNRVKPKDDIEARNLGIVREAVEKVWDSAPTEVKDAYRKAQQNYKTLYAPMFKEGVNFNLDRTASKARAGEGYYAPDKAFDPYLDKGELVTKMQQFDALWSGKLLGKRVDEAYMGLGRSIQDRYHKEVFGADKLSEANHAQFMKDYDPVFQRVPWAREAIEKQYARASKVEEDIKGVRRDYGETMKSPLDRSVGVDKANQLVAKGLRDPATMNKLIQVMEPHGGTEALIGEVTRRMNIMKDGQFDPQAMERAVKNAQPGLLTLYTKAYGPQQAKEMVQNLQDIALLGKRQRLLEEKKLPPSARVSEDPIKGASGSSGASWMSYFRSTTQGYTSVPYIGVLAGGRYLNARLQSALVDAEQRAFNDPATAKAVLELYAKKPGEPLGLKAAKQIWSAGRVGGKDIQMRLMHWLIDRDYVTATMAKGAQIGTVTNREDDE